MLFPSILGIFIGVFVDKVSRRSILLWSNIIRVGALLLIPLWNHNILILYLLMFIISFALQFFAPAEASILPTVVKPYQLTFVNGVFFVTYAASLIAGFIFADPIILWMKLENTHLLIAGMYTVSALMVLLIKKDTAHFHEENFMSSLKEGLTYIKEHPYILNSIIQVTSMFAILSSLVILVIALASSIGIRTQAFGSILAPATVGFMVGAWIANIFHKLHPKILSIIGFVLIGILLVLLSNKPSYNMTLWYSFIIGIGVPIVMVPIQTYLQRNIRNEMRGKVFGLQSTVLNVVTLIPMVLVGILADTYGVSPTFFGMGIFVIALGIILNLMRWDKV